MTVIGALLRSLWVVLPALLMQAAVTLGFGYVAYSGLGQLMEYLETLIATQLAGISADVYAVLDILGLPQALSIVVSAYGVRLVLMGLNSAGVLRRIVWRPPATELPFPGP